MSTEFYLDSDDQDHIERYTLQDIANLFGEMDKLKEELAARDAEIAALRAELKKANEITIEPKAPGPCLSWEPHEGPPHMTPTEALRLYHEKRSNALARTVMTDEQRAEFVGDSKPS